MYSHVIFKKKTYWKKAFVEFVYFIVRFFKSLKISLVNIVFKFEKRNYHSNEWKGAKITLMQMRGNDIINTRLCVRHLIKSKNVIKAIFKNLAVIGFYNETNNVLI